MSVGEVLTLPDLFDAAAIRWPDKTAIIDGQRQHTYAELRDHALLLAARLHELEVGRGDVVSIYLPNGIEFLVAFMAASRLGAAVAPLNVQYREHELGYYLTDCRARALITSIASETRCRSVAATLSTRCDLVLADQVTHSNRPEIASAAMPDDPLIIQYSSGSTGAPKRISRTHRKLVGELASLARALSLTDQDRFLGTVPFSHVNGLVRTMLASQSIGATLVSLPEFQRQKALSALERERITIIIAVPFVFGILADSTIAGTAVFSSIRLVVSASAPMPALVNRRFLARSGHLVRQLYGSTETGSISVDMSPDIERSLESVGAPLDGVEIRIVTDEGTPVAPGEEGEVAVKSPFAITAYDNLAPEEQPFKDGFFLTGDVGRCDAQGRLYLVGRRKFFINKGGYKINPREIEAVLEEHPKVQEAVVVGVPSEYGDERVKAVVVPRSSCSTEELIAHCRGRIADFKSPSLVEFRDSLPKSSTGKILRSKL